MFVIKYFRFSFIFMWKLQLPPPPREKSPPLFPSNSLLKVEVLSNPPLWKFVWRLNPLPAERGDGGNTMINVIDQHIIWSFAQTYKQRFLYWVQKTFVSLKQQNPAFKLTGITKSLTKHTSVQQNSHCSEY